MKSAMRTASIASAQEPGRTVVPAVDLTPTGHLPFVVQAAGATRERADELPAGRWSAMAGDGSEDRAFCLAVDAIEAAFAATDDPDGTWRALRSALNLTARRDAITGEKW